MNGYTAREFGVDLKTPIEINFDGLPGPYHNYGGLAYGNIASMEHGSSVSNPLAAALQGIAKMRLLVGLGVEQALIPPHERPDIRILRRVGYKGSDQAILQTLLREDPRLLASVSSSSPMWAANSATVSPAPDTIDNKLHITPANLTSQLHRSIEADFNYRYFKTVFAGPGMFQIHDPLPGVPMFSDEGAANHIRLCPFHNARGLEIFVYGGQGFKDKDSRILKYPARQTLEASKAVQRLHNLEKSDTMFIRQSTDAINSGIFDNVVICFGNVNTFFILRRAFEDFDSVIEKIRRAYLRITNGELNVIQVSNKELTLQEAVQTYLFNSQLVTGPNGEMWIIAAVESKENQRSREIINRIVSHSNPITKAIYVDIRQSMKNGGGPACLRLRIVMDSDQLNGIHQGVRMDVRSMDQLEAWVKKHYRDRLSPEDLADPLLLTEIRQALDELTDILGLGSFYPFQW